VYEVLKLENALKAAEGEMNTLNKIAQIDREVVNSLIIFDLGYEENIAKIY